MRLSSVYSALLRPGDIFIDCGLATNPANYQFVIHVNALDARAAEVISLWNGQLTTETFYDDLVTLVEFKHAYVPDEQESFGFE